MKRLLSAMLRAATGRAARSGTQTQPTMPDAFLAAAQQSAAYRTAKGMFFGLRNVAVVGRSTELCVAMKWSPEADRLCAQASVPAGSFGSGNGSRNRHVAEILEAPQQEHLRFRTDWIAVSDLRDQLARGVAASPEQLDVGGQPVPTRFDLRLIRGDAQASIEGRLHTTFSDLGIDVPRVGPGGMVADPREELERFVRVQLSRLPRAEQLQENARSTQASSR